MWSNVFLVLAFSTCASCFFFLVTLPEEAVEAVHNGSRVRVEAVECGKIQCVGALIDIVGQESERKAAEPKKQDGRKANHTRARAKTPILVPVLVVFVLEEVVGEQSPEARRCVLPVVPNP